jgi:hypothetical protein
MAFINRYKKQDDISTPAQTGGQAAFTSTQNSQPLMPQNNQDKGSGSFTNLQKFLDANKNSQFGQTVANKIQGKISDAGSAIGKAQNEFTGAVESGLKDIRAGADIVNKEINSNTTSQQLNAIAEDKNKSASITNAGQGQYKGPTQLDTQGSVRNQVQGATDLAKLTGSEDGRFVLLKNLFNKQGYTRGQQNLDNLMLQNNAKAQGALQGARRQANTLGYDYNSVTNAAMEQANKAAEEATNIGRNVRDSLGGVISKIDTNISDTLRNAKYDAEDTNDLIQNYTSRNTRGFTGNEYLDKLMLGTNSINFYGLDPKDYLKVADPTKTNVATPEQIAQLNALKKITGNLDIGESKKVLTDLSGTTQAGTYQALQGIDAFRNALLAKSQETDNIVKTFRDSGPNTEVNTLNPTISPVATSTTGSDLAKIITKYGLTDKPLTQKDLDAYYKITRK